MLDERIIKHRAQYFFIFFCILQILGYIRVKKGKRNGNMTYPITPEIKRLLARALQECGNNKTLLARRMGIDPSYVSKYLSGAITAVQWEVWRKICAYFPELDEKATVAADIPENSVPVLSLAQAAEQGGHPFGSATVVEGERATFMNPEEGDWAIRVSGNSMLPWYPPGTTLLIDTHRPPRHGDRVVCLLAGDAEPIFKIFVDYGATFELVSINERDGIAPIQLNKMEQGFTWLWVRRIKESIRDEADIDRAMRENGIRHAWEKRFEERAARLAQIAADGYSK